ncbi:MAG: hypothetical protein ACLR02_11350 [Clostridium sp.]
MAVNIKTDDDENKLVIKSVVVKKPEVNLKYEQITGINVTSEEEILEKSKSVTGRAVIGGVLLGPLGAIVGGMSGIGDKKKEKTRYYLIINYKSKDDEIKVLSFEVTNSLGAWDKFIEHVRKKINVNNGDDPIYL